MQFTDLSPQQHASVLSGQRSWSQNPPVLGVPAVEGDGLVVDEMGVVEEPSHLNTLQTAMGYC